MFPPPLGAACRHRPCRARFQRPAGVDVGARRRTSPTASPRPRSIPSASTGASASDHDALDLVGRDGCPPSGRRVSSSWATRVTGDLLGVLEGASVRQTYLTWESACGPVRKQPEEPPTPYRPRASPRLYTNLVGTISWHAHPAQRPPARARRRRGSVSRRAVGARRPRRDGGGWSARGRSRRVGGGTHELAPQSAAPQQVGGLELVVRGCPRQLARAAGRRPSLAMREHGRAGAARPRSRGQRETLFASRWRRQVEPFQRFETLVDLTECDFNGAEAGVETFETGVHVPQIGPNISDHRDHDGDHSPRRRDDGGDDRDASPNDPLRVTGHATTAYHEWAVTRRGGR